MLLLSKLKNCICYNIILFIILNSLSSKCWLNCRTVDGCLFYYHSYFYSCSCSHVYIFHFYKTYIIFSNYYLNKIFNVFLSLIFDSILTLLFLFLYYYFLVLYYIPIIILYQLIYTLLIISNLTIFVLVS